MSARILLPVVLMILTKICTAQQQPIQVSTEELQYFRFLLMNIASIDHDPNQSKNHEDKLLKQFGLNNQEVAIVHAAGRELNALLLQLRQEQNVVLKGKNSLSQADLATASQREQKIEALANRVLNQVRPEIAARLQVPGRRIAETKRLAMGK